VAPQAPTSLYLMGLAEDSVEVAAHSARIAAMLAPASFCYYHPMIGNVTSM
jgi:hypothetical protein